MDKPTQIRVTQDRDGMWIVVCGDRYHAMLGPDEAAWVVIALMMGTRPRYQLLRVSDDMKHAANYGPEQSLHWMENVVRQLRTDIELTRITPLDD